MASSILPSVASSSMAHIAAFPTSEDGRHPYSCWLLLFQNKVLDVDGMKVKLQVRLQEGGAGDTRERLGSMTSACCHRSGTQLVRSGSEVSPMPTTGTLMVSP